MIFLVVSKPLAIYVSDGDGRKWLKLLYYTGPVHIFTLAFNIPYLFQFECGEAPKCSMGKQKT